MPQGCWCLPLWFFRLDHRRNRCSSTTLTLLKLQILRWLFKVLMTEEYKHYKKLSAPMRISMQNWPDGTKPLVSICCITYNHLNFIEECIEGFLNQETTFPVEILIHDDASTDGTDQIVRRYEAQYPKLIRVLYQTENQFSKGLRPIRFLRPLMQGEYIAICEGDDFWVFSKKLEKQINLAEKDSSLSFIGGRSFLGDSSNSRTIIDPPTSMILSGMESNSFFKGTWLHTNTRLIKKSYLLNFWDSIDFEYTFDLGLVLYSVRQSILKNIKIGAIDDVVGFYRVNGLGIWSSKSEVEKFIANIKYIIYFMRKYKDSEEYQRYLMDNLK